MKRVRIEDDSESNYDYEDGAHGQCCSDSLSRPNDDDDNDNDNGDNDCNNIEKGWMTQRKSHKSRRTSRAKKSGFRLAHFYKYKIIEPNTPVYIDDDYGKPHQGKFTKSGIIFGNDGALYTSVCELGRALGRYGSFSYRGDTVDRFYVCVETRTTKTFFLSLKKRCTNRDYDHGGKATMTSEQSSDHPGGARMTWSRSDHHRNTKKKIKIDESPCSIHSVGDTINRSLFDKKKENNRLPMSILAPAPDIVGGKKNIIITKKPSRLNTPNNGNKNNNNNNINDNDGNDGDGEIQIIESITGCDDEESRSYITNNQSLRETKPVTNTDDNDNDESNHSQVGLSPRVTRRTLLLNRALVDLEGDKNSIKKPSTKEVSNESQERSPMRTAIESMANSYHYQFNDEDDKKICEWLLQLSSSLPSEKEKEEEEEKEEKEEPITEEITETFRMDSRISSSYPSLTKIITTATTTTATITATITTSTTPTTTTTTSTTTSTPTTITTATSTTLMPLTILTEPTTLATSTIITTVKPTVVMPIITETKRITRKLIIPPTEATPITQNRITIRTPTPVPAIARTMFQSKPETVNNCYPVSIPTNYSMQISNPQHLPTATRTGRSLSFNSFQYQNGQVPYSLTNPRIQQKTPKAPMKAALNDNTRQTLSTRNNSVLNTSVYSYGAPISYQAATSVGGAAVVFPPQNPSSCAKSKQVIRNIVYSEKLSNGRVDKSLDQSPHLPYSLLPPIGSSFSLTNSTTNSTSYGLIGKSSDRDFFALPSSPLSSPLSVPLPYLTNMASPLLLSLPYLSNSVPPQSLSVPYLSNLASPLPLPLPYLSNSVSPLPPSLPYLSNLTSSPFSSPNLMSLPPSLLPNKSKGKTIIILDDA